MANVTLEKWYADFLTPDGMYLFVYFAFTRIFFYHECKFSVTVRHADGQPGFSRPIDLDHRVLGRQGQSVFTAPFGSLAYGDVESKIDMTFPDLAVDLTFRSGARFDFGSHALDVVRRGQRRVTWRPVSLAARVSGRVSSGGRQYEASGASGYIDHLFINFIPVRSVLRELFWGRIHHPELDLTFTLTASVGGRPGPRQMIVRAGRDTLVLEDCRWSVPEWRESKALGIKYPGSYQVSGRAPGTEILVRIKHETIAVESDFIGELKLKSSWRTGLFRLIARFPRSLKFLSLADVTLTRDGARVEIKEARCINEYVLFGR